MSPSAVGFRELKRVGGFLSIEDHGLIGDGKTAALIGRDGSVCWMCVPRFDSPPLFCGLLDRTRGGAFTVAPEGLLESRQEYLEDTGVLVTELRSTTGLVRVTDALLLRAVDLREDLPAHRGELLRQVEVLHGRVRLRVAFHPRGDCQLESWRGGLLVRLAARPEVELVLRATQPLAGSESVWELAAGERAALLMQWNGAHCRHWGVPPEEQLAETVETWRRWASHIRYEGPQGALVRRSALTLKLLDYFENGAIIAAPTSSLPEAIGGSRNWDYRYAWIRDAAFSVYALRRIGLGSEAFGFLGWVLEAVERHGRPRVLYDLDGNQPPPERIDPELEGYRGSAPVRWGNAAAEQRQHDVFGEILDCAYQWVSGNGTLDAALWSQLAALADAAAREWQTPDHGIWEVRTAGRPFTYSAALCHVALDRAARLASTLRLPGDIERWRTCADTIERAIHEEAWDPKAKSITEHLGGGGLDASLLALPLRRVLPADTPLMRATTDAIHRHLGAGKGLLYRYLPRESPDGLPGDEGAFLLCSFWLVDNLALQGRLDEAMNLYDSLCQRAGPLGLLPEQIDPTSGAFLGNYPQALSHVGLISSGVLLERLTRHEQSRPLRMSPASILSPATPAARATLRVPGSLQ
ncbi:glycoside hydrolase family 15 protein [Archangium violaceum]|uniref:glycoside hydrolase family 15 protein n=1 Tax=Archangium violaceum TaxID=83451 RepID=UPI002B2F9B3C|nr:glycoside hydrolase family 15 protein [Archangium violaceum]